MEADAEVARMSAERDALFSGGDPDDPRFSRKGRDLIMVLQNATAEGRLKRQLVSLKRKHQEATEEVSTALGEALRGWKKQEHFKGLALS